MLIPVFILKVLPSICAESDYEVVMIWSRNLYKYALYVMSSKLNVKVASHSDPDSKKIVQKIRFCLIYPSQVIEVHFCVKNSYFFIFIKLASFGLFYLMNYKKSSI